MADDEEKTLSLRVAKAIPSDVGHGRARVPFDNDLGLKPGDVSKLVEKGIPPQLFGGADPRMQILASFESMVSFARMRASA